jgi:hypothetical protein
MAARCWRTHGRSSVLHTRHPQGTSHESLVLPLTGRFFLKPLGKTLRRVGAGVAWMRGGGLYGRPLLEDARPVIRPPHPAPARDHTFQIRDHLALSS